MPKLKNKVYEWSAVDVNFANNKYCRTWKEWKSGKKVNCWEMHKGEDCESILDLNTVCPIGIEAPRLSHVERLYAGIATVLVPQNERHRQLCKAWHEIGCGLCVSNDIVQIRNTLHLTIKENMHLASFICRNGQSQIDGVGGSRIAKSVLREAFC